MATFSCQSSARAKTRSVQLRRRYHPDEGRPSSSGAPQSELRLHNSRRHRVGGPAPVLMTLLGSMFAALGVVLVLSGAFKLADPAPTAAALGALPLRPGRFKVRLIGLYEIALGVAALAVGVPPSPAWWPSPTRRWRRSMSPCWVTAIRRCPAAVSDRSAPVSWGHVAVDAGAALVAAVAAALNGPVFFTDHPSTPAALIARVAIVCLFAVAVMAPLVSWPVKVARLGRQPAQVRPFGPAGGIETDGSERDIRDGRIPARSQQHEQLGVPWRRTTDRPSLGP